jgi:beta-galactosidase
VLPVIGPLEPWAEPGLQHLHRLSMHSPLGGFSRRSLDGRWSFELFHAPDRVPASAITGARRRAVDVDVPSNWTLDDAVDDIPHYTNIQMPFAGPPPRLPERNPTGVYRRTFEVPERWRRGRVVLGIDGAESVHAVYVNGAFSGYGTDSRLPSEYDITAQLIDGANEIAIVVVRFSAHSYLEDQDQWWMAGLHRPVWIESRPTVHIADLPIEAGYDHRTGVGRVAVSAHVDLGGAAEPGWVTRVTLYAPDGAELDRATASVPHLDARPYVYTGSIAQSSFRVEHASPWSAESPVRYTVGVELVDPRGRGRQTETVQIGLRSIEIRDRRLLVNGAPVWIHGVNRHDQHPDRGKAVTVDDMRDDLVEMRRHNITAIRTAHYPNRTELYDLCDELGFYVVDEADIECHAYNRSLADDPRYRESWLERGARMVQRDRNHPCIVMWSLGNESGYGVNHDALAGWIRRADPSRPLHYEDAIRVEGWADGGRSATDVVCPMYPEIVEIIAYGETGADRPLIMCEYSHAMGNSNGSLADYWRAIYSTPGLQGGFLWEWKDHTLRQALEDGSERLAYGGQFGDAPHDGNFVADGLMSGDLVAHPAMREVAWVYRPVAVERARGGVRIVNRQSFRGLDHLVAQWDLIVDGEVVDGGELDVPDVPPHGSVVVPLPARSPRRRVDAVLRFRWTSRADSWFAAAGHLIAWDQVLLGARTRPRPGTETTSADHLLLESPRLNLWRAAVDNDGFKLMPELAIRLRVGGQALREWQEAGIDRVVADDLVAHTHEVEPNEYGTVHRHVVDVPDALVDLPRIGSLFRLPPRFDSISWYGHGPHENYPDRAASAMLGVWEVPVVDCPYVVPQEYGLRTDCRWFELWDRRNGDVVVVEALAGPGLHVSATRHTPAELFAAATLDELPVSEHTVVCVDLAHRGLGTASCGPDVLPAYRLGAGRFEFAYRIARRRATSE